MLFIFISIAVANKVKENLKVLKAKNCLILCNFLAGVSSIVTHFTDKIHTFHKVFINDISEFLCAHKTYQIILVRHGKGRIDRIHPLYCKLHRPAAVDDARGRIYI